MCKSTFDSFVIIVFTSKGIHWKSVFFLQTRQHSKNGKCSFVENEFKYILFDFRRNDVCNAHSILLLISHCVNVIEREAHVGNFGKHFTTDSGEPSHPWVWVNVMQLIRLVTYQIMGQIKLFYVNARFACHGPIIDCFLAIWFDLVKMILRISHTLRVKLNVLVTSNSSRKQLQNQASIPSQMPPVEVKC